MIEGPVSPRACLFELQFIKEHQVRNLQPMKKYRIYHYLPYLLTFRTAKRYNDYGNKDRKGGFLWIRSQKKLR